MHLISCIIQNKRHKHEDKGFLTCITTSTLHAIIHNLSNTHSNLRTSIDQAYGFSLVPNHLKYQWEGAHLDGKADVTQEEQLIP